MKYSYLNQRYCQKNRTLKCETVAGIVEHIPDIGHFIKTISDSFYKLKSQNSEYIGVALLNPVRIKIIASDVSCHLRSFKKGLGKLSAVVVSIWKGNAFCRKVSPSSPITMVSIVFFAPVIVNIMS